MNKFIQDFLEGFMGAFDWTGLPAFWGNPLWAKDLGNWYGKHPNWKGQAWAQNNPRKAGLAAIATAAAFGLGTYHAGDWIDNERTISNLESDGYLPLTDIASQTGAYEWLKSTTPELTYETLEQHPEYADYLKEHTARLTSMRTDGRTGIDIPNYNLAFERFVGDHNSGKTSNYRVGRDLYYNYANDGWLSRGYTSLFGPDKLFKSDGTTKAGLRALQRYLDVVDFALNREHDKSGLYASQAGMLRRMSNNPSMSREDREQVYLALADAAQAYDTSLIENKPVSEGKTPEQIIAEKAAYDAQIQENLAKIFGE